MSLSRSGTKSFSRTKSLHSSISDSANVSFSTGYQLSREGAAILLEQLEAELSKLPMRTLAKFHESKDTFTVHCDDVELNNLTRFFIPYMVNLFNDDSGSEDHENLVLAKSGRKRGVLEDSHSFPESVRPYEFKCIWTCYDIDAPLEGIIPRDAREKIASLTGCEVVASPSQPIIYIGGVSAESCRRALYKLGIISKYFMVDPDTESLSQLFYTEGEVNAKVVLQTLASISSKLEQTTLLDHLQYPEDCKDAYEEMKRIYMIRCCDWDPICKFHTPKKAGELSPAVHANDIHKGLAIRSDYTYQGRGDESSNDMIQSLLEYPEYDKDDIDRVGNKQAVNLTASIMEWSEGILGMPKPQKPLSTLQRVPFSGSLKQDISKSALTNTDNNRLVPLEHSRPSKKDVSIASIDLLTSDLPLSQASYVPRQNFSDISEVENFLNSPLSLLETNEGNFVATGFEVMIPQKSGNASPQSYVTEGNKTKATGKKHPPAGVWDGQNSMGTQQRTTALSHIPVVAPLPAAKVAQSPTAALLSSQAPAPRSKGIPYPANPQDRRESQLYFQVTPSVTKGFAETQRFGNGMQLPPGTQTVPQVPQPDPSVMFQNRVKEMAKSLVYSMRNWQGDIRLEARFGRILICNPHERFLESQATFDEETVIRHLHENSPYQPTTYFTRILTTFPAEAQYLIHLKENGYLMWRPAALRAVKYEFHWTDQDTYDSYLLEIDAETFTSKVKFNSWKTEQMLIHCPLRLWDFAINASMFRNTDQDKTGLWREISDSLYIQHGLKMAKLTFTVSNEYPHMKLDSIRVRHTRDYHSSHENSALSITEVVDLKIERAWVTGGKRVFSAMEYTTKPKPGCPHSWYEVGISSTVAREAFKENESLEFGEEASWTAEKLERIGVFSVLCLTACKMIKRIDGIGFYNDNGVRQAAAPPSSSSTTHRSQPSTGKEEQKRKVLSTNEFW